MRKSSPTSRLRRSCVAALTGASAWLVPSLAFAQAPAPPPGQKPPCVPAASYTLAYDCELFPLPSLAGAAPAAAPVAAVVAPVAVVIPVVVPAPVAPPAEVPAAPAPVPEATPAAPPPAVAAPPPKAPDATSDNAPSHVPAYIAFAVGAAGVGATVAFGILALQAKSTLNGECAAGNMCPTTASSTVSTLQTDGIIADVGLGVAVVGVGLGVILFATEHGSSSSSSKRHVEPWVGLGSGGLKGTF